MTGPASFDVHTLLGDPGCSICEGTGEMPAYTYNRRPTRDDTECCVCVEPYLAARTCDGCGEIHATAETVAACPCWVDDMFNNLSLALSRAAVATVAARTAA